MGRCHTAVSTGQAVLPAPKVYPRKSLLSAQVKIKELRIISSFDFIAGKSDFVKGNTTYSKKGGFHCSYNLKYSLSVDIRLLCGRSLRLHSL